MRIHHLNAVSLCPLGGNEKLACHCLLLESNQGLVMIDTGLGTRDLRQPRARIGAVFRGLLPLERREEMTAVRQVEQLGYDARDVRHIVLTHLDFDHAGGLDDFPHATVHLMSVERDAAFRRRTWLDRQRYRPQQWSSSERWHVYQSGEGEPWFGFDAVRELEGVTDEVLLVPLRGHTFGHAGVAVKREEDWILLAGDAYFYRTELDLERAHATPRVRLFQRMMEKDRTARLWNQGRLRELKRTYGDQVKIFCSHDPVEFEAIAHRPMSMAIETGPGPIFAHVAAHVEPL